MWKCLFFFFSALVQKNPIQLDLRFIRFIRSIMISTFMNGFNYFFFFSISVSKPSSWSKLSIIKTKLEIFTPCKIFYQNIKDVLLFLFLTLNIFRTFLWCFYCWFWTSKCRLGLLQSTKGRQPMFEKLSISFTSLKIRD